MNFSVCNKNYNWPILCQKSLLDDTWKIRPICVLLSNYFEMSTLDYSLVSAQIQRENVTWSLWNSWLFGLSCRSAACRSWVRGFVLHSVHWLSSFVFVVCWIGTELVTGFDQSYPVCLWLTVCDIGTSTYSHPSPQCGCSATERK